MSENFAKNYGFVTSQHAIFGQNKANIKTATTPSFLKQFQIFKRQKTQNDNLYKMAISKFQKNCFLTMKFSKQKTKKKKHFYKIQKNQNFQKPYNMCVMCIWTMYMQNFKSIGP